MNALSEEQQFEGTVKLMKESSLSFVLGSNFAVSLNVSFLLCAEQIASFPG